MGWEVVRIDVGQEWSVYLETKKIDESNLDDQGQRLSRTVHISQHKMGILLRDSPEADFEE
jgi:hypothetical protein